MAPQTEKDKLDERLDAIQEALASCQQSVDDLLKTAKTSGELTDKQAAELAAQQQKMAALELEIAALKAPKPPRGRVI